MCSVGPSLEEVGLWVAGAYVLDNCHSKTLRFAVVEVECEG